jgi:hypothetical protein
MFGSAADPEAGKEVLLVMRKKWTTMEGTGDAD